MKPFITACKLIGLIGIVLFFLSGCGSATTDDLFSGNPGGSAPLPLPPAEIVSSFFDFDGAPSATTIVDSSGNGMDATLNNMTLANWVTDPEMGQVLSFESGSQTTADLANDLTSEDSFSVSLWVKADGATVTSPQHIFWQGNSGQNGWGNGTIYNVNHHEFHISYNFYNNCVTGITVYFGATDPLDTDDCSDRSENAMVTDSTTVVADEWIHIVAVVNGANTATVTVKLYVNGVLKGTDTGTEVDRSTWAANARLGGPGAAQRFLDADLDQFRVYDEALSDSEVLALYLEK